MAMYITLATNVVIGIAILIAGWIGGNWVSTTIQSLKKLDSTLRTFLAGSAKYAIFAFAVVTVLSQFGVQTASLLAILGAAGLAIGLALQGTLSNVASGVMLLFLRPFNVGDTISCGPINGTVKSLGLFATELSTAENIYIFAPNSSLWNTNIMNYSRYPECAQTLSFGVCYGSDINAVFKTIEQITKNDTRILQEETKSPQISVTSLGETNISISVRVWSKSSDASAIKVSLYRQIKDSLETDGIALPFGVKKPDTAQNEDVTNNQKKASSKKNAA